MKGTSGIQNDQKRSGEKRRVHKRSGKKYKSLFLFGSSEREIRFFYLKCIFYPFYLFLFFQISYRYSWDNQKKKEHSLPTTFCNPLLLITFGESRKWICWEVQSCPSIHFSLTQISIQMASVPRFNLFHFPPHPSIYAIVTKIISYRRLNCRTVQNFMSQGHAWSEPRCKNSTEVLLALQISHTIQL